MLSNPEDYSVALIIYVTESHDNDIHYIFNYRKTSV